MDMTAVTLLPLYIVLFLAVMALVVYQDASARARKGKAVYFSAGSFEVSTPVAWAVGCLFLWVFFMPLYITCRRHTD